MVGFKTLIKICGSDRVCFVLVSRHRTLMNNAFDKSSFVVPSSSVIGDVQIRKGSSVLYGCVLRGEALISL